jgi:hypothetical protein
MITRETVRNQIVAYLNQQIELAELVDWAENALCETNLEEKDARLLGATLARLGGADIVESKLLMEDYFAMLAQLGYRPQVVTA